MDHQIREATSDDFEDVFALFQQLHKDKVLDKEKIRKFYDELIQSDVHFAYVAVSKNKVIGYMDVVFRTYHFAFDFVGRIETTVVDENLRRQGIATALTKKCEEKAKEMGCKIIELDSMLERKSAHKFYESCGYRKRGFLFWKKL